MQTEAANPKEQKAKNKISLFLHLVYQKTQNGVPFKMSSIAKECTISNNYATLILRTGIIEKLGTNIYKWNRLGGITGSLVSELFEAYKRYQADTRGGKVIPAIPSLVSENQKSAQHIPDDEKYKAREIAYQLLEENNRMLKAMCAELGVKYLSSQTIKNMLKTQVIGHLGRDASVNVVNGQNCINFSVAHTQKYKDKNGNVMSNTTWVNCSYWIEKPTIADFLKKGTLVYVEGIPQVGTYKNREGHTAAEFKLRVTSIQLLSAKKEGAENQTEAGATVDEGPDDLPF